MLKSPWSIYNYPIKSYETDRNGKMTWHSFFHYLQESAYLNAQENDFGYEFLERENAYWVLTRVLVQLDKMPKWTDTVEIKTWPRGADGLFAVRDFNISVDGEQMGRVTTYWMIVDKETRRPKRLDDYDFLQAKFIEDKAFPDQLNKINSDGDFHIIDHRKVYASDLDVNGHVNNAAYVRWVMDAYSSKNKKVLREFEINFLGELMLNDEFDVMQLGADEQFYYTLKNMKGRDICRARLMC